MRKARGAGGFDLGGRSVARRTGITTLAILTITVAAALIIAHDFRLGVAATVVSALVGGGSLAGLYLAWAAYREATRCPTTLAELANQLAHAVREQWEAEARIRRLYDPYPLPVSWSATDPVLTDSWSVLERLARSGAGWTTAVDVGQWASGPGELAGEDADLAAVLARVPTGRLLVLGEPGSGKTILMIRLVLDILAARQSGSPVPYLVSLASWNPAEQDLRSWLAARLDIDHPGLRSAAAEGDGGGSRAEALLRAALILPLLDGLDEIPPVLRASAIARINDALRAGEAVVVTCRTEDYRRVVTPDEGRGVPIGAAAAVELNPLTPDMVAGYLVDDEGSSAASERWAPVLAMLGSEAPVAQALSTPLMVALARVIYNPRPGELVGDLRSPAELCGLAMEDRLAVESSLFDAFIPAAYRTRPGSRWTLQQAERCLMFLAAFLDSAVGGTDIAWWQLRQVTPAAEGREGSDLEGQPRPGIPAPAQGLGLEPHGFHSGAIGGLVLGALLGTALAAGANRHPPAGLLISGGIVGALTGGAALGTLMAIRVVPGNIETAVGPQRSLMRDVKIACARVVSAGATAGLIFGAVAGLAASPGLGIQGGVYGFCLGSLVGLVSALIEGASGGYAIACTWLALRHQVPRQLMTFLEDAHERGVLRQAGAVYQFRHIELQHRLARKYDAPAWFGKRAEQAAVAAVRLAQVAADRSSPQRPWWPGRLAARARARR
jgi:hypothetical protein